MMRNVQIPMVSPCKWLSTIKSIVLLFYVCRPSGAPGRAPLRLDCLRRVASFVKTRAKIEIPDESKTLCREFGSL